MNKKINVINPKTPATTDGNSMLNKPVSEYGIKKQKPAPKSIFHSLIQSTFICSVLLYKKAKINGNIIAGKMFNNTVYSTVVSNDVIPNPIFKGVPNAPNVTAVVLAANGRTILVNGLNPIANISGATSIAGMPNPAMPSIKLPINKHKIITLESLEEKAEVFSIILAK